MELNKKEIITGIHIISEPGDGTRYDYIMLDIYDEYVFAPFRSTFRFPQRLNYWEIKNADEEKIISIADKENCNPYTVKECIRAIKESRSE